MTRVHDLYWVTCVPCGIFDQPCPSGPEQTRFVNGHYAHGAKARSTAYRWPPAVNYDCELRFTLGRLGDAAPATEAEYYR